MASCRTPRAGRRSATRPAPGTTPTTTCATRHAIVVTGGGAGSGNSQSIVKGPLPAGRRPRGSRTFPARGSARAPRSYSASDSGPRTGAARSAAPDVTFAGQFVPTPRDPGRSLSLARERSEPVARSTAVGAVVGWRGARGARPVVARPGRAALGRGRRAAGHRGAAGLAAHRPAAPVRGRPPALMALHPGKPARSRCCCRRTPGGPLRLPRARALGPRRRPARRHPSCGRGRCRRVAVDAAELDDPADELRYGASVAHLRAVAAFADDLAARGRVLPTLDRAGPVAPRPVAARRAGRRRRRRSRRWSRRLPPVGRAERPRRATSAARPIPGARRRRARRAHRRRRPRPARPRRRRARRAGPLAGIGRRRRPGSPRCTAPDGAAARRASAGSARWPRRCAQWDEVGTEPPGAGRACFRLAEVARCTTRPRSPDDTGDGTHWRAGVPPPVHRRPEPARPRRAGLVRRRRPADRGAAGAAARRARPRRPRDARRSPPRCGGPPRRRSTWSPAAPTTSSPPAPRCSSTPGSGCSCPRVGRRAPRRARAVGAQHAGRPGVLTRSGLGREELADFRWSLAVGDEELSTRRSSPTLVAAKAPLVRLRGGWVSVDAERAARAWSSCAARGAAAADRRPRCSRWPAAIPTTGRRDEEAAAARHRRRTPTAGSATCSRAAPSARSRRSHPPPGFHAQLRPYQQRGRRRGWRSSPRSGLGACLADDMGLGKTVQLLALETHERAAAREPGPTLLLCPMSLVGTWQREAARFAPRAAGAARTTAPAGRTATTLRASAVGGRRPRRHHLRHRHPRRRRAGRGRLAPARARRGAGREEQPRARTPRAVRRFDAEHRVALTGTPVENRLAELWSIMDVLNPGLLGTADRFRARLRHPGRAPRQRRGRGAAAPHHAPVPAAPGQDRSHDHRRPAREDRDHAALPAHPRAGHALPHGRRRHDGEDRRLPGHRAPRQRARRDGQAQAGLQPPGPAAARRLADRPPLRQGRAARGDPRRDPRRGRPRAVLHPVRRVRAHARAAPVGAASTPTSRSCTAARPKKRRDEMVARFQARRGRRRSCCSRSRRAAPGSPSPPPTTWCTSTAGGTRPSRTRPPTARSASGSGATSRCASSSAPAPSRSASTR